MYCARLIATSLLATAFSTSTVVPAFAQKPGPQFWRRLSCEPIEPRTRLEAFEESYGTVLMKGFTQVSAIEVRGVRVDAVELRDLARGTRVMGIVIALGSGSDKPQENRAFIDYEEIDPLLSGLDAV